jgi:hypothetical protein
MEYGIKLFDNIGAINSQLTEDQLAPIIQEISDIKDNWASAKAVNDQLAGNIEHEYALVKCFDHVEETLLPLIYEFDKHFKYFEDFNSLTRGPKNIALSNLWVNFQKKYEFNPLHYHDGLLTFVIWIDSPFDIKDEMSRESIRKSNTKVPGHFSLVYIGTTGKLGQVHLPVDRSWNGRILIFPAAMHHCVYPFYTSDEYRISVSGNFVLDV